MLEKHLQLMQPAEKASYYERPLFEPDERPMYFALDDKATEAIQHFTHIKSKLFFILQLGYFRARQQFFKFDLSNVLEDATYVMQTYFSHNTDFELIGTLGRDVFRQQRHLILSLCEYDLWSTATHESMALIHLARLMRTHPKGQDTLREFLNFMEKKRITLPSYRILQDLFTCAFKQERDRLDRHIATMSQTEQVKLQALIQGDNDKLSHLALIRCDQEDFKYQSLKTEIKKLQSIADLYLFSKTFISKLELSKNAVRYYASVAEQYTAARLRKLSPSQQSVHILCFIFHRYQEFIDNLITTFLYHVKRLKTEAKQAADAAEITYLRQIQLEFPNLERFLRWYANEDPEKVSTAAAFQAKGFDILAQEKQTTLADFIAGELFDKKREEWKYFEEQSRTLALYLRPILMVVPFQGTKSSDNLLQLIDAMRQHYGKNKSPSTLVTALPEEITDKIPTKTKSYLKDKEKEQVCRAAPDALRPS